MRVIDRFPDFPVALKGLALEAYTLLSQPEFHAGAVLQIDLEGAAGAAARRAFRQALALLGGSIELRPGGDDNTIYIRFRRHVRRSRSQTLPPPAVLRRIA